MGTEFRHLNKRERDSLYPLIADAQGGAFCNNCGATRRSLEANKRDSKLIVDRINNQIGYWIQDQDTGEKKPRLSNLQLVCKGCNKRKEYEKPLVTERPMTPEMVVNNSKEPFFRKYIHGIIETDGKIAWDDAVDGGAEFIGISVETAKRYLRKMISSKGDYELGWGQGGGHYIYEKGMGPNSQPYDDSENSRE